MSAVNQYNFPNSSPQYDNPYLSHLSRTFSSTSTDATTEDELDDLEDGSAHSGVNHSSNGKRHCHTCGMTGQWQTTNEANQHSAYGSDTDSSKGTKSLATADDISASGLSDDSWYNYAEPKASQDSVRSQQRQAMYKEMGHIINLINNHNKPKQSQEDISLLDDLDTFLLARWKDVLHEIGDRDGEQTTEDQHLTAVLGMAIGHTRRLHARSTNEAPGTDLHQKILRHATARPIK